MFTKMSSVLFERLHELGVGEDLETLFYLQL